MRTRNADHNRARRLAILEAAATCFVRYGFHTTRMKDVCAAAGMSPGTLYHYFRSKSALIAGIVEDEGQRTRTLLAPLETAEDFIVTLFEALDQMVASIGERDLVLYAEVAAEILRDPALREQARVADEEAQQALAAAIRGAQRLGTVYDRLDADHMARLMTAFVDGWLSRATLHGVDTLRDQLPSLKQSLARILVEPEWERTR